MTNYERAKRLINDARSYKKEAEEAFRDKEWNKTIRRAQESIELYLKGLLKIINIEFPKIHDVGKIFVEKIKEKGIEVSEEKTQKIVEISSKLTEMRAPAFYREEEYSEDEALEAIEGVRFVSEIAENLLKELSHE